MPLLHAVAFARWMASAAFCGGTLAQLTFACIPGQTDLSKDQSTSAIKKAMLSSEMGGLLYVLPPFTPPVILTNMCILVDIVCCWCQHHLDMYGQVRRSYFGVHPRLIYIPDEF